jgi:hypothetical protein
MQILHTGRTVTELNFQDRCNIKQGPSVFLFSLQQNMERTIFSNVMSCSVLEVY